MKNLFSLFRITGLIIGIAGIVSCKDTNSPEPAPLVEPSVYGKYDGTFTRRTTIYILVGDTTVQISDTTIAGSITFRKVVPDSVFAEFAGYKDPYSRFPSIFKYRGNNYVFPTAGSALGERKITFTPGQLSVSLVDSLYFIQQIAGSPEDPDYIYNKVVITNFSGTKPE